jgi:ABC-type antimicrobial peptide transport system permease subunit
MSYAVTQGRREIGVRIALGAQRGEVLRMVIWEESLLAFGAIALGIGGALGLTRPRASLLYCGVSHYRSFGFRCGSDHSARRRASRLFNSCPPRHARRSDGRVAI